MEVRIRPMTEEDLLPVSELENRCFTVPWSLSSLRLAFQEPAYVLFVAETEGEIAGYAGYFFAADTADLATLAVDLPYRRQGIARRLVSEVLRDSYEKGVRDIFLEVRESNAPARALYDSLGFQAVGRRKDYYECPREDGILMKYERRLVC